MKISILICMIGIMLSMDLFCQDNEWNVDSLPDSNYSSETNDSLYQIKKTIYPWMNEGYLAAGYSTPQGLRNEIGFNFYEMVTLGITLGLFDNWSTDPGEGTIGYFLSLNIPLQIKIFTPYMFITGGTTIKVLGSEPDKYLAFGLGSKSCLNKLLVLRPEIGIVNTRIKDNDSKPKFYFNLTLEFNYSNLW